MTSFRLCSVSGLLVIVGLTLTSSGCDGGRYDGYQLLEITPHTKRIAEDLMKFLESSEFNVWRSSHGPGDPAEVMVNREKISVFKDYVRNIGLKSIRVKRDNFHATNRGEVSKFRSVLPPDVKELNDGRFSWTNFHSLDSINSWLEYLVDERDPFVTLTRIGQTHLGRHLTGVRIRFRPNLPIVIVIAGIHGREWIGPATATWFIAEVLKNQTEIFNKYEWHVFPVVNPDGYDYSRVDRGWRKNRRRSTTKNSCGGVDLNRNWPFKWQRGSRNQCGNAYPGPEPRSEPETQALIAYMDSLRRPSIHVFFSLRGFGQMLLYPWSYTTDPNDDRGEFHRIGEIVTDLLIGQDGTVYNQGSISTFSRFSGGGSPIDYAYKVGIKYSFEYWHRYKKNDSEPASQYIIPTVKEATEVITTVLQEAL